MKRQRTLYLTDFLHLSSSVTNYQFGPDTKTTVMVWACDAKGRDSHNKKHTKYEGDGNPTRGRPKMRWLDILKSDMRIFGINPEMATDRKRWAAMVKNVDTTHMVEHGNG